MPTELYTISGIDLTRIDGVNVLVAQTLIAEVGLGLCPDNITEAAADGS